MSSVPQENAVKPASGSKANFACNMAAMWLHRGNLASERGDRELAERHYARAQKWQDQMNELLGND